LAFGFTLAMAIVGGFIYLAMHDRPKSAPGLIGAGVLGLVTGFQTVRLGGSAAHQTSAKRLPTRSKKVIEPTATSRNLVVELTAGHSRISLVHPVG
jgi:hypothetical protein